MTSTHAVVVAVPPPRPVAVQLAQAIAVSPVIFHPMINTAITARAALPAAPPAAVRFMAMPASSMMLREGPASRLAVSEISAMPRTPVEPVMIRSDVMALHVQELSDRSTPRTITSKNFKLSFDYCLVRADRLWLSGSFLTARNWYVPHTKTGEIASGTGLGGGLFEVLPVAALVVRNLVIEADWSQDDIAVQQSSVKFGPFALVGRSIDSVTNTLSCKGMCLGVRTDAAAAAQRSTCVVSDNRRAWPRSTKLAMGLRRQGSVHTEAHICSSALGVTGIALCLRMTQM